MTFLECGNKVDIPFHSCFRIKWIYIIFDPLHRHFLDHFTELHSMKRCRLWKQSCQPNLRNSNISRKITKPTNPLVQGVKLQQQQMHPLLWGSISHVFLSWLFPRSDFFYTGELFLTWFTKKIKSIELSQQPENILLGFLKNSYLITSPHPHWLCNLMCRFWNFCLEFFLLLLKLPFWFLDHCHS